MNCRSPNLTAGAFFRARLSGEERFRLKSERATGADRAGNFDATARRDLPHDGERIFNRGLRAADRANLGCRTKRSQRRRSLFSSLSLTTEMFIPTGYGVEGALPDATCYDITHNVIAPFFKKTITRAVLKPASPR